MVGLLVAAALWTVLFVALIAHRTLVRSYKLVVGLPLVAYGVVSLWTLGASYYRAQGLLAGFEERRAAAASHMARAMELLPDSVRHKRLVNEAAKLHGHIGRSAAAFGPRMWGVAWKWGAFPRFEARLLAKNLMTHVETPPLLVWAVAQHARQAVGFARCTVRHGRSFPMSMSRTALFTERLMADDLATQKAAALLCDLVDFLRDDPSDARSPSYRLAVCGRQMVAKQAKITELLEVGCDGFDEFLYLRVRRGYPGTLMGDLGWQPYSPLFMEYTQLLVPFQGLNTLEIRWMGDQPVPVVGSVDALYRLECEVRGRWPDGQERWSDPETGKSGPTYYVNATTYRYYTEGAEFAKWPSQPDIRSVGIATFESEWRFAGLPVVVVNPSLLLPPGMTDPLR